MYQNATEGKFMLFDEKLSKTTEPYSLAAGLYSFLTDIVETISTLVQEKNNHNDTCIRTKVLVTQKTKTYLANEESSLTICRRDLEEMRIWSRCAKCFRNAHSWKRSP